MISVLLSNTDGILTIKRGKISNFKSKRAGEMYVKTRPKAL